MEGYDVVLGLPWLKANAHLVDWSIPALTRSPISPPHHHTLQSRRTHHIKTPIRSAVFASPVPEDLIPVDAFPISSDPPDYVDYLRRTVPREHHNLLAAFSKSAADSVPRSRGDLDHTIDIIPGSRPTSERIRPVSSQKLASQSAWVDDMRLKGFIQPSKSPYGANLTSAGKQDGTLRWCIDYRRLNAITIKDRTPLPLISESLVLLGRARLFTRLDLRSAFNQILMDPISLQKPLSLPAKVYMSAVSCPLVLQTPLLCGSSTPLCMGC